MNLLAGCVLLQRFHLLLRRGNTVEDVGSDLQRERTRRRSGRGGVIPKCGEGFQCLAGYPIARTRGGRVKHLINEISMPDQADAGIVFIVK